MTMKVEFYLHNLGPDEKQRMLDVLDSVFLTTGEATYEFERKFSEYLGVPYTIGVMSATAALHLAMLAFDIGEGDEVITTPMTFIASANAVMHAGATPVFVDVEPGTGNLDASKVEAAITPRTKAILPVHLYGQLCDMRALRAIADKHGLKLIEDSAHAVESLRDGVRPGQLGDAACFSFYATKNITCGEGGAVTVHTKEKADLLRKLSLHGMTKNAADRYRGAYQHWDMDTLGWKYNLSNVLAALLISQVPKMDAWCARREAISRRYEEAFSRLPGIDFPRVVPGTQSARHLFTIWVDPAKRDATLARIQALGVSVAVNFRAIHLLSYYRERFGFRGGEFPVAENIGNRTITLPLYPRLTDEQVSYVIDSVAKSL
jgi:dTDP-4-amino-4,6-dideoxygalactose transaminase